MTAMRAASKIFLRGDWRHQHVCNPRLSIHPFTAMVDAGDGSTNEIPPAWVALLDPALLGSAGLLRRVILSRTGRISRWSRNLEELGEEGIELGIFPVAGVGCGGFEAL